MATGIMQLFPGGIGPDGTTDNVSAALTFETSGTAATSGDRPAAAFLKLLFDGVSTNEYWLFSILIPGDYSSGGTIRLTYKMTSATTGDVKWIASQGTSVDGSTDHDALALVAAASVTSTVPGTQGQTKTETITLTTTNMAANRACTISIGRDASDTGTDTAAGDAELLNAVFEYVTT